MSAVYREGDGAHEWIEVRGRSVDEAVVAAAERLGVSPGDLEVHVLVEPSRGWLGLVGQRDAVVRARVRMTKIRFAERFLQEVAARMGLRVQVRVEERGSFILARVEGDHQLGALIGRRGAALEALQYLMNVAASRTSAEKRRVLLDIAGYREKRQRALERLAFRMAERARRLRRPVSLEPMDAKERRVIHVALQHHPHVRTESVGEEPFRRVVIVPKGVGAKKDGSHVEGAPVGERHRDGSPPG